MTKALPGILSNYLFLDELLGYSCQIDKTQPNLLNNLYFF